MWDHFHEWSTEGEEQFAFFEKDLVSPASFSMVFSDESVDLPFAELHDDWIVGFLGLLDGLAGQLSNPDVSEPYGVPVVLQADRNFTGPFGVGVVLHPRGRPEQLDVVLDEHTVVHNGHSSRLHQSTVLLVLWRTKEDIVGLPLAWFAGYVGQGRILAVDRGGLSIGISHIVERIEDLHFELAL